MAEAKREATTLVSVDLDDLVCYHAIHGLPPPSDEQRGLVLERCLPRFLELFDELGVRATFFVIGRDLERDLKSGGAGAKLLQQALRAGHELANHSYAHSYDLVTKSSHEIFEDILRCDVLLRSIGARPQGFRAPGYTHDRNVVDLAVRDPDELALGSIELGVQSAQRPACRAAVVVLDEARGHARFGITLGVPGLHEEAPGVAMHDGLDQQDSGQGGGRDLQATGLPGAEHAMDGALGPGSRRAAARRRGIASAERARRS